MARESKTLKTTMMLTLIIILSKTAGFAREIVRSATFGQTIQNDAYSFAYSLITILMILFSTGIGSTFIPIYTKNRLNRGEESANRYANSILNLYIICAIVVSVIGFFVTPAICGLIWQNPEGLDLTIKLTQMMFPALVFWAISGVLTNVLNARKIFIPEQLTNFSLSFCMIFACMAFGSIEAVAVATAISAALQILILIPYLRKNYRYERVMDVRNPEIKRTFLLAVPAVISMAFDEINNMADKFFGTAMGTSVVTALGNSYTLVQSVLGILVVPITTIMFSQLSQYAALKQHDKLKSTVRQSLEIVALITLPIIVVAFVNSQDIIGMFYQRGKFTLENTLFTAPIFAFYILGIFAFGMRNFLTRVFYALQLNKIPMLIGIFSVTLNIVLDILLKDVLGAKGLTLATSVASFAGAIIMMIVLRKRIGNMHLKKSAVQFIKIFIAAGACAVVTILLHRFLPIEGTDFGHNAARLLSNGLSGIAVFAIVAYLLKIEMAGKLMRGAKNRLRRKKT